MNAANNLALMQIGPAVADHDSQAMNEPATKQDLYNMGVQIDSNFGKVISQFTIVDSQLVIQSVSLLQQLFICKTSISENLFCLFKSFQLWSAFRYPGVNVRLAVCSVQCKVCSV